MYTNTILASVALLATSALASTTGSAVIVNACTYPVYLSAVPAADGGYSEIDQTLQPTDSWTQQWTELSNGDGWSLKLSMNETLTDILQYEYTFQNDGTIWYDLSCVNGNPWDGNWEITAAGDSTCVPKQSYYRYATDDAYGMQSCASDASVTVTLCSGEDTAASIVSSVVAAATASSTSSTSVAVATTSSTSTSSTSTKTTTTTSTSAQSVTGTALGFYDNHFYEAAESTTVTSTVATTFATSTTAAVTDNAGDIYIEVVTVIETATAYETYVPGKRHVHHPNHPHHQ